MYILDSYFRKQALEKTGWAKKLRWTVERVFKNLSHTFLIHSGWGEEKTRGLRERITYLVLPPSRNLLRSVWHGQSIKAELSPWTKSELMYHAKMLISYQPLHKRRHRGEVWGEEGEIQGEVQSLQVCIERPGVPVTVCERSRKE